MAEDKKDESQEKSRRNKKLNKLSLAEIEKKLEEIKSSQGGLSSRYARELLRRRDILRSGKP